MSLDRARLLGVGVRGLLRVRALDHVDEAARVLHALFVAARHLLLLVWSASAGAEVVVYLE